MMAHGSTAHSFIPGEESTIERPADDITVEMDGEAPLNADGALITMLGDGGIEVDFDPETAVNVTEEDASDHYVNIAKFLSPSQRMSIAQDVIEMVDADITSRQPWYERIARGLDVLGVRDEKNVAGPFNGASTVVHPLIAEGCVQFQARAFAELFPATGPAKAVVLGERTKEREEQRDRVANYLNYQSTTQDKSYYPESDMLLWMIAYEGSVFRKSYNDPLTGMNVRRIVRAEHFVVPYSATTLETAPRYTHIIPYSQNEMRKLQKSGFFLDIPLGTPAARNEGGSNNAVDDAKAEAEGKVDPDTRPEDRDHTAYEMTVEYDIPGFEDKDEAGNPTGIALPYVITVERDTSDVLAIRRAWKASDPLRLRRTVFTHYAMIRGDGFYGYGYIHLAGGLGRAATGVLRAILDNAAFAALQGGFKSKDAKLPSDVTLEPGKWKDTDLSAEELTKAFFTPPFKDVPAALFSVLEYLGNKGERLLSTTENTVGDASNTGPVGTTVALIEQGSKIQTGVHKRLHQALGEELKLLADLNGEYLPGEGYPYDVEGESREVFKTDFDERVDVQPVSDPNIFSQTQRIAIAQTELDLAMKFPGEMDVRVAIKRMLTAVRSEDVDELLPEKREIERADPVTENALAIVGKPVKVFLDQMHDAHIQVHMGELQQAVMNKVPYLENLQRTLLPHIAEHAAMSMRLKFAQQLGVPLPPMNLDAKPEEPMIMQMPPQVENAVAMKAAQIMQQMLAQIEQAQAQAQAQQGQQEGAAAQQDFEAEQRRKDEAAKREEHRKDIKTATEIERKDAMSGIDPNKIKEAQEFIQANGLLQVQPRKLAVLATELGRPFADVIKMLMMFSAGGQGEGASPTVASPYRD